ncbi:UDP-phosphate alpha N-acetylglucosaminyltransferase [Roseibium sediminis]|uniref:UDP-phosphate alpha N-acetylglucosaminyltransferase n=1 Tax=Roseibium sediminis TaxID=1775174 RepID=UPI00123E21F7|nr:UDP-phosphate alpha N-acetylglucosaminyltransferase [Roseibium sediminis]
MSSWKLHDRTAVSGWLQEQADRNYRLWLFTVFAVVTGCFLFNLMLAFVNTNVARISENTVMLSEMTLLSVALVLALDRRISFYAVLFVYLTYIVLIMSLRPELDLKAIRDILIPITFYFIGRNMRAIEDVDRLVFLCATLVISFGLFEMLFLDVFTGIVNIFEYYVARGTLQPDDNYIEGSNLFISATRVGGRYFLPFLGDIRSSSVFLEPVTMGNFGAFLFLWATFRTHMRFRFILYALAIVVIIMGDARFGGYVCIAFLIVAPVYRLAPKFIWWALPFAITLILALYGSLTTETRWEDNFPGRILNSALLMQELSPAAVFGLDRTLPFLDDNGYAYTLGQIGIVGMLALWTLFIYAPTKSDEAFKFKVLAATYVCLMFSVSNAFYSIKMAALFWIAAGAADNFLPGRQASTTVSETDRQKSRAEVIRERLAYGQGR